MPIRVRTDLVRERVITLGEETEGEESLQVTVKKADNFAVIQRRNLFDTVRYITEDEIEGRTVTERKFPMGDLMLQTIMFVIKSWNLRPSKDAPAYPLTPDNIATLLTPEEFQQLYDAIIDMNPVWGGAEAGES